MYEIYDLTENKVIAEVEEPRYVYRSPRSGVWLRCDETTAECVAINGRRYTIRGRANIDDAPPVVVRKADTAAKFRSLALEQIQNAETVEEIKAAYTDLAIAILDLYTKD